MHFINISAPPGGFTLSEIQQTPNEKVRGSIFALPMKSEHTYFLRQNLKEFPEEWKGMRFASMVICVHEENEVEVTEIEVNTGVFMWFMHKKDEHTKKILEIMAEHRLLMNHFCHVLFSLHPKSPIAVMSPTFTHVYGGAVEEVNEYINIVRSL